MTWHSHLFIALMQVNHSRRMNETPLKPWVAATNEGTVVTAHCNCMAGLGGACSHVGAILFAVGIGVTIKRSTTCTSVPCKWLMPSPAIAVSYQVLRDIDFTSSKTNKENWTPRYLVYLLIPANRTPARHNLMLLRMSLCHHKLISRSSLCRWMLQRLILQSCPLLLGYIDSEVLKIC